MRLPREYIINEDSTLRCPEISSALSQSLLIEQLMDYANTWSSFDGDSDHARDVV